MTEPVTVGAIIGGIEKAIEIGNTVVKIGDTLKSAELKMETANLMIALADAKVATAGLTELLSQKDSEIKSLKDKLKFKEKLVFVKEAYFEVDQNNKPTGDPYCMNCWETKAQAVHLILHGAPDSPYKNCPACGTRFRFDY